MSDIRVNLDQMESSANDLMKAKAGMHDGLNNLDNKMNAIREMVSDRLRTDIEFFMAVKANLVKEFQELDRLKAELDEAVVDFRNAGSGGISKE
ncbi:MAG: hypothetical protein KIT46_02170 [Anaerolineales bacterium]|nr:hypothetical protein [Anaerolineales bacterium]MCW5854831.1 hypothetical protein [Anaerolineales bacterium]